MLVNKGYCSHVHIKHEDTPSEYDLRQEKKHVRYTNTIIKMKLKVKLLLLHTLVCILVTNRRAFHLTQGSLLRSLTGQKTYHSDDNSRKQEHGSLD